MSVKAHRIPFRYTNVIVWFFCFTLCARTSISCVQCMIQAKSTLPENPAQWDVFVCVSTALNQRLWFKVNSLTCVWAFALDSRYVSIKSQMYARTHATYKYTLTFRFIVVCSLCYRRADFFIRSLHSVNSRGVWFWCWRCCCCRCYFTHPLFIINNDPWENITTSITA